MQLPIATQAEWDLVSMVMERLVQAEKVLHRGSRAGGGRRGFLGGGRRGGAKKGTRGSQTKSGETSRKRSKGGKSVRFQTHDFSTVDMPMDVSRESHQTLTTLLRRLSDVLALEGELQRCADERLAQVESETLADAGKRMGEKDGQHGGLELPLFTWLADGLDRAAAAARSANGGDTAIPAEVIRAATMYACELRSVIATGRFDSIRHRFINYVSCAVRHHCRMILNPPPAP